MVVMEKVVATAMPALAKHRSWMLSFNPQNNSLLEYFHLGVPRQKGEVSAHGHVAYRWRVRI